MTEAANDSTMFFIRRLTPELTRDLVGDAYLGVSGPHATGWDRLTGAAKQVGIAVSELIGLAMRERQPRRYGKGGVQARNLYGCFLLIETKDSLHIHRDPGTCTVGKDAAVYIVADLVGMPLARFTGTARGAGMSVLPGGSRQTDGTYVIDLWLDPGEGRDRALEQAERDRVGRFLHRVLGDRDSLTVEELVATVQQRMGPHLEAMLDVPAPDQAWIAGQPIPDDRAALAQAIATFQRRASTDLGVSVSIRFRPGSRFWTHRAILSEEMSQAARTGQPDAAEAFGSSGAWRCQAPGCDATNDANARFCGDCGGGRPSRTGMARGAERWKLVSRDGQSVRFEVDYVSYATEAVAEDDIVAACIDALSGECATLDAVRLEEPGVRKQLDQALNATLTSGRYGQVGEFSIAYVETDETRWKRTVRASIREQVRSAEQELAGSEAADAWRRVREQQLLSEQQDHAVRRDAMVLERQRVTEEAAHGIAQAHVEATSDVRLDEIRIQQELDKRRTSVRAAGDEARFTRDLEQQVRGYAREDEIAEAAERRSDEMADLSHDLTKEDLVQGAQRRAEEAEAELKARIERLKGGVRLDEQRQQQGLELDAKRGVFAMETERLRLEAELKVQQLQAMAQMEAAQREQASRMTPAQLLAMQASSLAEKGAADALNTLAGHDSLSAEASAEARVARAQADMLERMMAMQAAGQQSLQSASKEAMAQQMQLMMMAMQQQQSTSQSAMLSNQEAIRAAMGVQQVAASRVLDAQQQTVNAAVSWNRDSIDALSTVAAAKAANPGTPGAAATASAPLEQGGGTRFCAQCGIGLQGARFCPECGTKAG